MATGGRGCNLLKKEARQFFRNFISFPTIPQHPAKSQMCERGVLPKVHSRDFSRNRLAMGIKLGRHSLATRTSFNAKGYVRNIPCGHRCLSRTRGRSFFLCAVLTLHSAEYLFSKHQKKVDKLEYSFAGYGNHDSTRQMRCASGSRNVPQ